jgi:hypothetical protein
MGLFSSIAKVATGGLSSVLGGGAGGLFGEISGNNASAASALRYQKEALDRQNALYGDARMGLTNALGEGLNELQPWYASGQQALNQQNALLGLGGDQNAANQAFDNFRNSTGYQFRFNQGQNALQNSAAAKGSLFSGAAGKALQDYGQNLASAEFGNYFGNLNALSQNGFNAAGNKAGLRQNYGNALAGIYNNQANLNTDAILGIAQTKNSRDAANSGGVGNLLGSAGSLISLGSAIFSDMRLKTNIEHVGHTAGGLPIYEYDYIWGGPRYRGIMAQDALEIQPDAVIMHDSGFYMVDYSKVN